MKFPKTEPDWTVREPVFVASAAVEDAYEVVARNRYVFAQNDRWSRVFY